MHGFQRFLNNRREPVSGGDHHQKFRNFSVGSFADPQNAISGFFGCNVCAQHTAQMPQF